MNDRRDPLIDAVDRLDLVRVGGIALIRTDRVLFNLAHVREFFLDAHGQLCLRSRETGEEYTVTRAVAPDSARSVPAG